MDKETINALKSILKDELRPIRDDITSMKSDITGMKSDITGMKNDITAIKSQQDENTQILRSLLESSEVHKAELDNINNRLVHIEGDLKSTKSRANLALDNAALNRIDLSKINKK